MLMLNKLFIVFMVLLLGVVFQGSTAQAATPKPTILLIHGLNGNTSTWNTAKAQYQAAGYTVYVLNLPYSGSRAGDSIKNAAYVNNFIAQNKLTNVQLDAHSLGGTVAFYIARVSKNPAVKSIVTRDSYIHSSGLVGFYCWTDPDECPGSAVRNAIFAAPVTNVPIMDLMHDNEADPETDCKFIYPIEHNSFLTDTRVTANAINWAQGICK